MTESYLMDPGFPDLFLELLVRFQAAFWLDWEEKLLKKKKKKKTGATFLKMEGWTNVFNLFAPIQNRVLILQ